MNRAHRAAAALAAIPGRILDLAGLILEPLRPEPGTTEASVYFGLILVAAAFLAAGDLPKALGVPGAIITVLGCAPAIVGILRKGS